MDLTEKILKIVESQQKTDSLRLAQELNEDHQKIIGSINSIIAHNTEILHVETTSKKEWKLSKEGQEIVEKGSHEANVFRAIPPNGTSQDELMKKVCKQNQTVLMTQQSNVIAILGAECESRLQQGNVKSLDHHRQGGWTREEECREDRGSRSDRPEKLGVGQ